jgi:hypothetical protein
MRGLSVLLLLLAAPVAAQPPVYAVVEALTTTGVLAGVTRNELPGHCNYSATSGSATSIDPDKAWFEDPTNPDRFCWGFIPRVAPGIYRLSIGFETLAGEAWGGRTETAITVTANPLPPPVEPPPPPPPPPPQECLYAISPTSKTFSAAGGTDTITVNATAGCAWTGGSSASFVTLQPTTGTGPGTVTITVTANPGAVRTAILMIAGQTFNLTQSAAVVTPPPPPPPSATCVFEGKTYQQGDGFTQPLIANMSSATFLVRLKALADAGFHFWPGTGRTQHQSSSDSRGGYYWIFAACRRPAP